jgi:cell division septal protein FtsQ
MTPVAVSERAAPANVEPRIQARREHVARVRQKRHRRRLLIVLVVVSLVASGWLATRSALLDVDEIAVVGATRTDEDEVRRATGISEGDALLDLDAEGVRRNVRQLPWVADAAVRVHWGGTVEVVLFESEPVAIVLSASGADLLVDGDGRVLAAGDLTDHDRVAIEGLEPVEPGQWMLDPHGALTVVAALSPTLRDDVDRVVVTAGGTLDLALGSGAVAWLGRAGPDLPVKLRALETVLAQVDGRDVVVYDVRVPEQVAVTRSAGGEDGEAPSDG